jgi:hypothetical protein
LSIFVLSRIRVSEHLWGGAAVDDGEKRRTSRRRRTPTHLFPLDVPNADSAKPMQSLREVCLAEYDTIQGARVSLREASGNLKQTLWFDSNV